MSLYSEYYLSHFGIKGQQWGKRRFENEDGTLTPAGKERYDVYDKGGKVSKKQLKEEYKNSIKQAKSDRQKAIDEADSQYEREMDKEKQALDKVKKKYDAKDAETEKYFKSEIEKHQRDAEAAKKDMDFWGESGGFLYQDAKAKYLDINAKIKDLEDRRENTAIVNKLERDAANIKVRELYAGSSERAADNRKAAYAKAGEAYLQSVMSAKTAYKESKKQGNSRGRS